MPFSNPIVGGVVLVRPAIRSPNFVAGSSGWSIEKDGSAEFNDVVIRGSVNIGGDSFYYDGVPGVGNLVASIAADGGTDPFGNTYLPGIAVYEPSTGAVVRINSELVARLEFQPQVSVGADYSAGTIKTTIGAGQRPGLTFLSPADNEHGFLSGFTMFGSGPGAAADSSILFSAERVDFSDDVEVGDSLTAGNMEWGTVQTAAPGAGGGVTSASVAFSKTFPTTPRVLLQVSSAADPATVTIRPYVLNETTTGFDINNYRSSNAVTNIRWWAVSD